MKAFRMWLGAKLVQWGLALLEVEVLPSLPEKVEEDDDSDGMAYPMVAHSEYSRQMIAEGMAPVPFSKPKNDNAPLEGSALDRVAKARAKYEMG